MTLYLVAVKAYGKANFTIADEMECPHCKGSGRGVYIGDMGYDCDDCEGRGFWFMDMLGGWRLVPFWFKELDQFRYADSRSPTLKPLDADMFELPPNWPDTFTSDGARVADEGSSLAERLGLNRPRLKGIERRD